MMRGTITVINKRKQAEFSHIPKHVYIGRPSVLGNPYLTKESKYVDGPIYKHGEAIDLFNNYLNNPDADVYEMEPLYEAMDEIGLALLEGTDVALVCWCAPRACHGNVIKDHILNVTIPALLEQEEGINY